MGEPANAITTAQAVGWSVTGIGIVISLGWNFYNSWRTRKVAEQLRTEQYRAGQWARVRDRIESALDDLVDASRVVVHQAQQLDESNFQSKVVGVLLILLVDAQDKLASALEEAKLSAYCEGDHWYDAANGKRQGSETSWDNVIRIMAEAEAAGNKSDMVAALKALKSPIGEIRTAVNQCCRAQDMLLDPEKI
ncbi:hypothetical protein [Sphingomonas sp.]|jgi:cellobiose-specific phosphotransferase system component IIA|uniref:hypothetical protein n=1 Tax=Sphingomonas sp. TaxID=28214 RepID=UPI002E14D0F2|nr:hypothetical protein [Sphingomonas sp.]